jgi:hypothetical protein
MRPDQPLWPANRPTLRMQAGRLEMLHRFFVGRAEMVT